MEEGGISVNNQGAHPVKEEAVSRPTIRIIGTFNPPVYSLSTGNKFFLLGISVGQIVPDEKPLYIKLKLDGVRFGELPPIDAKSIPEQRDWSFILWVLNHLCTRFTGGLKVQSEICRKVPS